MTQTDPAVPRTSKLPGSQPGSATLLRFLAPAVVLTVGVVLLFALVIPRLFDRAPALEEFTKDFRPLMSDQSIGAIQGDLDGIDAAINEFGTKFVPTVATALAKTPDEVSAFIADQFPDVAVGLNALPAISEKFRGLANLLEAEQPRFRATDEIPTSNLPPQTVPWAILVLGLASLALGAWLGFTRTRPAALGAVAFGVIVLVATLAMGLQGKATDADTLGKNVRPVFVPAVVDDARQSLATVGAMAKELQEKAIPAIGSLAGIPADQLPAFIAEQFPALTAVLDGLPETSQRFSTAIDLIDQNRMRYQQVAEVPFGRVIWTLTYGAIAILAIGLWSLLSRKTTEETSAR